MNALDRAFIKAFAKDRTPSAAADRKGAVSRAQVRPPTDEVESEPLVVPDRYQQGQRLRIDRPEAGNVALDAHMILPFVEQVDSYDPQQVAAATQPAIVVEDRLASLEEFIQAIPAMQAAVVASPAEVHEIAAVGMHCESSVSEPSAVAAFERVHQESSAVEDDHDSTTAPPDKSPEELEQEFVVATCEPRSFCAFTQLDAPELMTQEIGQPAKLQPHAATDVSSLLMICHPAIDLDALAGLVNERTAIEATDTLAEDECEVEPESEYELVPLTHQGVVQQSEQPGVTSQSSERPLIPLAPAWEVDAFRWPEVCHQWDERTEGRLTQSGEELCIATQEGLQVLAITSATRSEGRTSVALSLARAAAKAGSKVALVDADSANPELARRLGMEAPCDWREVVGRGESLSEAAVASLEDGVTLFPRTFPTDDEPGMRDPSLVNVLGMLRSFFDLVIVDLSPIGPHESSKKAMFGTCPIDLAVVVRNIQATSTEQTLKTVTALRSIGVKAVGVIENFTGPHEMT